MSLVKNQKDMKRRHRLQEFQSTIRELTEKMRHPKFIKNLKEELTLRQYWKTVDLK